MATSKSSTTSRSSRTSHAANAAAQKAAHDEPTRRADHQETVKKPRKKRAWLRVLVIVLVALLVIAAALAALFVWDRWYRYDDAADIQGKWYPAGSLTAVEIGPDTIAFDAETAYSYTIDTGEKSITYALSNLRGKGHYWFANDRNTLVIEDCDDFAAHDTSLEDLKRMIANLGATVVGNEPALPEGDGASVFARTPDPAAVAAKEEADRQAAAAEEAKRQAEEESARAEEKAERAEAEAEAEAEVEENGETAEDSEGAEADGGAGKEAKEEPKDFSNESMGIFE